MADTTISLKAFLISHLLWAIVGLAVFVGFRSWRAEHDARLASDAAVKVSQVQVESLQAQIAARDKAAVATVAPVIKVIHDVQTTPQAIAALPAIVTAPLPTPVVPAPNNAILIPQPDVLPIFQQLGEAKVCAVQLSTAQKDLTDTKAIVSQRDEQIKTLSAKPKFWHRVESTAKKVGIGIGIGLGIALVVK